MNALDVPSPSEQAVMDFVDKVESLSLFQERIEKPARLPQIWDAFKAEVENQITPHIVALFLVDPQTHAFELKLWTPLDRGDDCRREIDYQIDCGTFAWIVNRRHPAVIPSQMFGDAQTLVMLPLATHARTLGVAMIVSDIEENAVTHERLKLLGILSKQCALVMENAFLYEQLHKEHQSLVDAQSQIIQAEKFASLGRLTSGAFHELLNPLNIISGHLQIMMLDGDIKPDWSDYLALMKSQADRIARIVNRLLRFTTKRPQNCQAVDPTVFLKQIVHDFAVGQSIENITLNLSCGDDLPEITVNTEDLKTVVSHLIDNACDAMPEGGRLDIAARRVYGNREGDTGPREHLEISIADSGSGVSKENTLKIFDPFFTTKEIGEGMGLSLAICYALTCSMGASISFDNQANGGAVFFIRFPVERG
jgi:signal transduction histidine kinase